MNEWLVAGVVLTAALVPCLALCALAGPTHALAALEVASTLGATVMMLLSEGFHRQPFIDLAVILALLSIVGAFVFTRMMEHDL